MFSALIFYYLTSGRPTASSLKKLAVALMLSELYDVVRALSGHTARIKKVLCRDFDTL